MNTSTKSQKQRSNLLTFIYFLLMMYGSLGIGALPGFIATKLIFWSLPGRGLLAGGICVAIYLCAQSASTYIACRTWKVWKTFNNSTSFGRMWQAWFPIFFPLGLGAYPAFVGALAIMLKVTLNKEMTW